MDRNTKIANIIQAAAIEWAGKTGWAEHCADVLLTDEPEPCELDEELLAHIDGSETDAEAMLYINAYASQVADKRVEELRAQVETLREAIKLCNGSAELLFNTIERFCEKDKYYDEALRLFREVQSRVEIALAAMEPKPSTKES